VSLRPPFLVLDVSLIVLLAFLFLATPAQAEPFLDLGLGATIFFPAYSDGAWYQEPFPHHFDTKDIAYRAGVGWRFNDHWSVAASYLHLGSISVTAQAVSDDDYNNQTHQCLRHCQHPVSFRVEDSYQGGELTATRTFTDGPVRPFLRAGGAWLFHDLRVNGAPFFMGRSFPAGVVGAGLTYKWISLEVSYYHILAHSGASGGVGYPVSESQLIPMVSVQIPLW
jgi:hypothetical protein